MSYEELRQKSYACLLALSHGEGINASGKDEAFGCIFGRDSFITILKIIHALEKKPDPTLLAICKRSLLKHVQLQGKEINIESGEQPGKFIHEYRIEKYERLTKCPRPWYIYPDKKLRNYDSLDATPLGLIALYRYWQSTRDTHFLLSVLPAVEQALNWIITYGDMDKDFLLEYELPVQRQHGGLVVQSWTDSFGSLADKKGKLPVYPIAPVEVQGIAWLALKLWADYYTTEYAQTNSARFGNKLHSQEQQLKRQFNKYFTIENKGKIYFAQALDGKKRKILTITPNPLLCLWAAYQQSSANYESIIEQKYIAQVVGRGFEKDLFTPHAGMRTMSIDSPTYNPTQSSYHNGSYWPMLNGLILEGLENFNYPEQAAALRFGMIKPLQFFRSPIELYIERNGQYLPYKNDITGQVSCKEQAWSAAAIYDVLTSVLSA